MKTLTTIIRTADGTAVINCPVGKRVRVVSIDADLVGVTEGEEFTVLLRQQPLVLLSFSSQPLTASIVHLCGAVGLQNTSPREAVVDVATGVITYDQTMSTVSMGLPDISWPFGITVETSGSIGATVNRFVLVYETFDA